MNSGYDISKKDWEVSENLINGVQFTLLSPEEVERMSVAEIKDTTINDYNLPHPDGVNDPRMGSVDRRIRCATCKHRVENCNGHFGHMKMPFPMYHVGYMDYVNKMLSCVCFWCSSLLLKKDDSKLAQLSHITRGKMRLLKVHNLCKSKKQCPTCQGYQPKYTRKNQMLKIKAEWTPEAINSCNTFEETALTKRPFTQVEAREILAGISDETIEILGLDPKFCRPEWMIITVLPVAPPQIRPSINIAEGSRAKGHDDLTNKLKDILKASISCQKVVESERETLETKGANAAVMEAIDNLQMQVATYFNNDIKGVRPSQQRSGSTHKGLWQRLKTKEGRVRGNLMGKRVNFSARTVISPDPNLAAWEVGVPHMIALKLTKSVKVTALNIQELTRRVRIGANNLNGAEDVVDGNNHTTKLFDPNIRQSIILQIGDTVKRYMQNGDVVLMNRQPSLHKMSAQAHIVRIMPGLTFRFNPFCGPPYNFDFDGDEMNMHFPQTVEAEIEAYEMMAVQHQIVSPSNDRPVHQLVQDTLAGAYLLTKKDKFFDRGQVMQLMMTIEYAPEKGLSRLFKAKSRDGNSNQTRPRRTVKLPQPAILRPKELWTGKQIISILFPDDLFIRKGVRGGKADEYDDHMERSVLIQNGELLCGSLCKATLGTAAGGIVHTLWRMFGPMDAVKFATDCEHLVHSWLSWHGLSIGISDCILKKESQERITHMIEHAEEHIDQILAEATAEGVDKALLEPMISRKLNDMVNIMGKLVQSEITDDNTLHVLTYSGAKGGPINETQVMAAVGQTAVEGQRIHASQGHRIIPSAKLDDDSISCKGFISSSYSKGLTPHEFFLHMMGAREGLVDTAVKTALVGYIQRRMMKALESHIVAYDGTIRNECNEIVSFVYGTDNLDASKMWKCSLRILSMNNEKLKRSYTLTEEDWCRMTGKTPSAWKRNGYAEVAQKEVENLMALRDMNREYKLTPMTLTSLEDSIRVSIPIDQLIWKAAKTRRSACQVHEPRGDRQLSDLDPAYIFGAVEKLCRRLARCTYTGASSDVYRNLTDEEFDQLKGDHIRGMGWRNTAQLRALVYTELCSKNVIVKWSLTREVLDDLLEEMLHYHRESIIQPGENVGALAAQALGHPVTQMSIAWDEEITVFEKEKAKSKEGGGGGDGKTWSNLKIGPWIDAIVARHQHEGERRFRHVGNDSVMVNIEDYGLEINSVDEDGNVRRLPIECVTRHPPNGDLVRVTTRSGRAVTATLAKSFLIFDFKTQKIVPMEGSRLEIGMCIPVRALSDQDDAYLFAHDYGRCNDIYTDDIVRIERVPEGEHAWVYDLSIPETLNFELSNGMQVRDTLNTFHFAGVAQKNVTLGMTRVKELIDVSKNIRSPSMTIPLKEAFKHNELACETFQRSIEHTMLSDIVHKCYPVYDPDPESTVLEEDREIVELSSMCGFTREIEGASRYIIRIALDRFKMMKKNLKPHDIVDILRNFMDTYDADIQCSETNMTKWVVRIRLAHLRQMVDKPSLTEQQTKFMEKQIMEKIANTLLTEVYVGGIPNISKAIVTKRTSITVDPETGEASPKEEFVVETNGTALMQVLANDVVDWKRVTTNDLYEIEEAFGSSIATYVLFQELRHTLTFDGTYINDRNPALLIITMTLHGYMMPISRHGINRIETGPLGRCSFEETVDVLQDAALFSENDPVDSVTGRIMLGQLPRMGTGLIGVHPQKEYQSMIDDQKRRLKKTKIVETFVTEHWEDHDEDNEMMAEKLEYEMSGQDWMENLKSGGHVVDTGEEEEDGRGEDRDDLDLEYERDLANGVYDNGGGDDSDNEWMDDDLPRHLFGGDMNAEENNRFKEDISMMHERNSMGVGGIQDFEWLPEGYTELGPNDVLPSTKYGYENGGGGHGGGTGAQGGDNSARAYAAPKRGVFRPSSPNKMAFAASFTGGEMTMAKTVELRVEVGRRSSGAAPPVVSASAKGKPRLGVFKPSSPKSGSENIADSATTATTVNGGGSACSSANATSMNGDPDLFWLWELYMDKPFTTRCPISRTPINNTDGSLDMKVIKDLIV